MLLLMDSKSEGSLTSFSGDESLHSVSEMDAAKSSDSVRNRKRRANNRAAAQRSRRKQTERADALHRELQSLEISNAAYEKEIASLQQEIQKYTIALQQHEPLCPLHTFNRVEMPLRSSAPASTPILASDHTPVPAEPPFSELTDSADWSEILESIL